MRSLLPRLARLEQQLQIRPQNQKIKVQYGNLKQLPEHYIGPRHVIGVKQISPESPGEEWFEWEERPGPGPPSKDTGKTDDLIVQVCYVEARTGLASVRID